MKQEVKVYLTKEDKQKLLLKAKELGFEGRGSLTYFFEKVAKEPIVFLDDNVKRLLKSLSYT